MDITVIKNKRNKNKKNSNNFDLACVGLLVYSYPSMSIVYQDTEIVSLQFPYIATFLAFREVDAMAHLLNKLRDREPIFIPQIILVDGQGILHPRRMGIATHFSILMGIPCIGIAKSCLAVGRMNIDQITWQFNDRLRRSGEFKSLDVYLFGDRDNDNNNDNNKYNSPLAAALKSSLRSEVIFVSPGNRISLLSALKIVFLCCSARYRLPIPVHFAMDITRKKIREFEKQYSDVNEYQDAIIPKPIIMTDVLKQQEQEQDTEIVNNNNVDDDRKEEVENTEEEETETQEN